MKSYGRQVFEKCGVNFEGPDVDQDKVDDLMQILKIHGNLMFEACAILAEGAPAMTSRKALARRIRALKEK